MENAAGTTSRAFKERRARAVPAYRSNISTRATGNSGETGTQARLQDPFAAPGDLQFGAIFREPRPRFQLAAQGGIAIGRSTTAGVSFTEQTTWEGDRFSLVGANLGVQLPGRIYLGMYSSRELSAGRSWSGGLTINMQINDRHSAAASSLRNADGQLVNTIQASQAITSGPGLGWRLAASDDSTQRLSAGAAYNGALGQLTAEASANSRANAVRLGANGSLEWMNGYAFASRRIDEGAFCGRPCR